MWLVFWADHLFKVDLYKFGILPRTVEGLKGIIFMPFIHSEDDFHHILNNTLPTFLLLAALIYYYREVALKVILLGWLLTGLSVWIYAENKGSYHIGMSGIIYLLAGFLFTSGAMRKYRPLQAISLFIIFLYGSMIWGIFPIDKRISWEGHFMGLVVGVVLAYLFKKRGPQRPKYQYEIEKEMGIEPPDLEGIWLEKMRRAELERQAREELENINRNHTHQEEYSPRRVIYHFIPSNQEDKPKDENET